MKFIIIIFMLFCALKGFYYGKFELQQSKNKFGGFSIMFLSIFGFILNSALIFF